MAQSFEVFDGLIDHLPEIPAGSVVTRMIHNSARAKVTVLGFAPGQALTERSPEQPAILEVWRGDGLVVLDGEAYEVGPGSWAYIEAETPHTIQSKSEMVVLLTILKP